MAGGHGHKFADLTLHAPKRWQVLTGQGMCGIMWLWILYRAKQDGPVLLGWRHPWDGHGHGHGHGHEHEHAAHGNGNGNGHEEGRSEDDVTSNQQQNFRRRDQHGQSNRDASLKRRESLGGALISPREDNLKSNFAQHNKSSQGVLRMDPSEHDAKVLERHPKVVSLIQEDG